MLVEVHQGRQDGDPVLLIDSTLPAVSPLTKLWIAPITANIHIGDVVPTSGLWFQYPATGSKAVYRLGYDEIVIALPEEGTRKALYLGYVAVPPVTRTPTYTVTYDGNGADSGDVPVDPDSPYESGDTVTVLGNTGTLAKTGKTFGGWNTAADGTGTAYAAEATFTISANTVLYAVWSD